MDVLHDLHATCCQTNPIPSSPWISLMCLTALERCINRLEHNGQPNCFSFESLSWFDDDSAGSSIFNKSLLSSRWHCLICLLTLPRRVNRNGHNGHPNGLFSYELWWSLCVAAGFDSNSVGLLSSFWLSPGNMPKNTFQLNVFWMYST